MANRKPIDYTPQSATIFRRKEDIEREIQEQGDVREHDSDPDNAPGDVRPEPVERRVVRHSFDIYHDQLQALTRLQAERFMQTGKKPKMGSLIQEALDHYLDESTEDDRTPD